MNITDNRIQDDNLERSSTGHMENEQERNDLLLHTEILLKVNHLRRRGQFTFKEVLDLYLLADQIERHDLRASSRKIIETLQKG